MVNKMEKNKLMIIGLIIVIIALIAGITIFSLSPMKDDCKVSIKINEPFNEGDSIKIKLTDLNDTPIANQTVNITITDEDNANSYYSAVTNDKGVAKLKVDKDEGNYNITVNYGGNDNFNPSNSTKKLKIEKEVVEAEVSSSSTSSGQSSYTEKYTTDEHGVYDNEHGVYISGQGEGLSKSELEAARQSQHVVNGNLE